LKSSVMIKIWRNVMKHADRLDGIAFSGIRKMFDMAGSKAVHLGLGEPDFQPPPRVIAALKDAVDQGLNKYGPTQGIPPLREAIADYTREYWDDVTADNILVTSSGTEALMITAMSIVNPGDEVLIPDPGFVLFTPQVKLCGGIPIHYPVAYKHGFVPQVNVLESLITQHTKALIVNSPSNPTGGVFSQKDIEALVEFAKNNDLVIISDEIYDRIVYDGECHRSFLGKYDDVIQINSFSKTLATTGWRIGFLVAPTEFIEKITLVHYFTVACPPTPLEWAVLAGLKGSQKYIDGMVKEFQIRRDLIVKELNSIDGFECLKPKGAFYAFPTYDFNIPSLDFATKLVDAGLVCTPGTAFGPNGEDHLRFSYANSRENILKGMEILTNVSKDLERIS